MKNINCPSKFEYYKILAEHAEHDMDYGKATANTINALHYVKSINDRDDLLYKLSYLLGKEGNLEFKEHALLHLLNYGDLKIKAALLLFINSYQQADYNKIDHYFRLMQECMIESMLNKKPIEPIILDDNSVDIDIFNNIMFDDQNVFPMDYVIDTSLIKGSTFGFRKNIILTTADDRANNNLVEAMEAFDRDDIDGALALIDKGLSNSHISEKVIGELYNAKAYILYQNNKIKHSFDCLQTASYYNKEDIKTLSLYLAFAKYSKNEALKEETIEAMLNVKTDNLLDIKIVISNLCNNKLYDKALKYIDEALSESPLSYDLNKLKGIVLLDMNEKDEALQLFDSLHKKYGHTTDIKFYLYKIAITPYNRKIYIDCMNDDFVDGFQIKMQDIVDKLPNATAANKKYFKELEFAFDYLLRLPYCFNSVAKNLVYYVNKFDKDHAFLEYILDYAYNYNSKYLIPLTYIHCLENLNYIHYSTANGLLTKNPLIDPRTNPEMVVNYSTEVVKGFYIAYSVVVNNKYQDKRMIVKKLYTALSVLDNVNRDALINDVKDENAFAALLYNISFDTDIIEDYDVFTFDDKVFHTYYKLFDIINYKKNFDALEGKIYDNLRGRKEK